MMDLVPAPPNVPTSDNEALSELAQEAATYLASARAVSTARAQASDWRAFTAFCEGNELVALPATAETVALYVVSEARTKAPATIRRRLATIARAHRLAGWDSPTLDPLVRDVFAGVRRRKGTAQRARPPLLMSHVAAMCEALGDRTIDLRDRALLALLVGSFCRRSEVVSLDVEDVVIEPDRLVVHLRKSKSDQEGRGRQILVPSGTEPTCPVSALRQWIAAADLSQGPLFRPVDRAGRVADRRLSGAAVCAIVRRTAVKAGVPNAEALGAHSTRAGAVTQAYAAGVPEAIIACQSGHRDRRSLHRYIRFSELDGEQAARALGL